MKLRALLGRLRGKSRENRATLEACEPRVLYSAELLPVADLNTSLAGSEDAAASESVQFRRHELVIIDHAVVGRDDLTASLLRHADPTTDLEVVMLDAGLDGVSQITDILKTYQNLDAVHLLSHGSAGSVSIGSGRLDFDTLRSNAHLVQGWSQAFAPDADLLIYGCELAGNEDGRGLVNALSSLVGVDVAASEDLTGAQRQGGDWELEYSVGEIQPASGLTAKAVEGFDSLLATYTVTNTNDSGAGSLREAIQFANLNPGADSIEFNIAGTGAHVISLSSSLPTITDTVSIDGSTDDSYAANGNRAAITLDGNNLAENGLLLSADADGSLIRALIIRDMNEDAIQLESGTDGVTIVGNFLGSLTEQAVDIGAGEANVGSGIYASDATNLTIGGATAADRNVISGNQFLGIGLIGAGQTGNRVLGNYIGVEADGYTALGNGQDGIFALSGSGLEIGSDLPGEGNIIAANARAGIYLYAETDATIQGNLIGTDISATRDLGNNTSANVVRNGVRLEDTIDVLVGGAAAGQGNIIAFNTGPGIVVTGASASSNQILGNLIHSNSGIAVDLNDDGVTVNDPDDSDSGANGLQNYPVLLSADSANGNTIIDGTLDAQATTTYRIEFFKSAAGAGDPSGYGEGRFYLGSTMVTTDGTGSAAFNAVLAGVQTLAGELVTANATVDVGGGVYADSSEYALNVTATVSNSTPDDIVFESESSAEQVVNSFVSGDQLQPAIATFASGGHVLVWVSNGQDGSGSGIYGQRFDAGGNAVGGEFLVTDGVADDQTAPSVSTFDDGGFVVAWQDQLSGVYAWTEARVFHADGSHASAEFRVSPGLDGNGEGYQPAVLTLDASNFAVVWSNETGGASYEIAGRIYDRAGVPAGSQFTIGSLLGPSALFGAQAELIRLDDGGFAAVWRTYDGVDFGSRLRVMNSDGTMRSAEIVLGGDHHADVAVLSGGNLVAVYRKDSDISARLFDPNGVAQGAEFEISGAQTGLQGEPTVSSTVDGFVVAWESDSGDGSGSALFVRRFASDGTAVGEQQLANTTVAGNQAFAEMATSASGQILLAWESENVDGSGRGVVSRVLSIDDAAVVENAAVGTHVADVLGVADRDIGDTHTFSLLDDAGGRFDINSATGEITVADGSSLDYEQASSHDITVQVTDSSSAAYSEVLTVNVINRGGEPDQNLAGAQITAEDAPLVFSVANGNAIVVGDTASGNTDLQVALQVTDGVLDLAQTTGIVVVAGSDGSASLVIQGSEADLNAALDGLMFTPDLNFNGAVNLQVTTSIAADLQGLYGFENGDARDDSAGISQDGVLENDAVIVSDGTRGQVLSLDGVDDAVVVPGLYTQSQQVTLAAWVDLTAVGVDGSEVVSVGDSVAIRLDAVSNGWGIVAGYRYSGNWFVVPTGVTIAGTGWHHIAFVVDSANDAQSLYLDGELIAQGSSSAAIVYDQGVDTLIGRHGNGSDQFDFGGSIDDVRVYSRAISADEVVSLSQDNVVVSGTVAITVTPVNDPPVPDAGGAYAINEGDSLSLDASATSDPDNAALTYRWDLDNDGDYDDLITSSPTAIVPWASLAGLGVDDDGGYTIGLQVDDGAGGVATTSVSLTINNTRPTLTLTGSPTADGGLVYTLNLSASDPGNDTITGWTVNWGDGTVSTYAGNPPSATHTYLNSQAGLAFDITASVIDEDGTHFDSDLLVPAYSGSDLLVFDGSGAGFTGVIAPSTDGLLGHAGLAQAANGNLLITGHGSHNVLEYQPDGTLVGTFIPAGSNGLSGPAGIAFGPDGNLYVSSSNTGKVLRFDASGVFIDEFVSSGLSFPLGLSFGPSGDLYVASQGAAGVMRYDIDTGLPVGGFNAPAIGATEEITFGPDGYLYAATIDNGVFRLNATTGALIDNFLPIGANLTSAAGVRFGPDGNLYVGDQNADSIRVFSPAGSYLGDYVAPGGSGLDGPAYSVFSADHRVTVLQGNQAPVFSGLDNTPTYFEGGAAVVLDPDVTVSDADLSAVGDFTGTSLTISRSGGAQALDVFSASGSLGALTEGANLTVSAATIGVVTVNSAGTLTLTFDNNASNSLINQAMQQIAYSHAGTAPPTQVVLDWVFDDANSGSQGSGGPLTATGSITVSLADLPEPAALTVPPSQAVPEDSALVFSSANGNAITIDSGSTFDPLVTVSIAVGNGTLTLAQTTGITFLDSTTDGSASMTLAGTQDDLNAALDGLTYLADADYNGSETLQITSGSAPAVETSLYARYTFPAGSTMDSSGNGLDGVAQGDPVRVNDPQRGDVLRFDGDDAVSVVNGTASLGGEVTIAAWVNLDAGQQDNVVISIGDEFYIQLDDANSSYGVGVSAFGFSTYTFGGGQINLAGDGWHHVAATLSDTTDDIKLYIDGELVRNSNWPTVVDWSGGASPHITIGGRAAGASASLAQMVGSIQDARVYDAVLSEAEIAAIMGDNGFVSATVAVTVNPVNDAPVLDPSGDLRLPTLTEDEQGNPGQTVAQVLASAGGDPISDVDAGAVEGIAIVTRNNGRGIWQYSLDGGSNWSAVGTVSQAQALLLRATDLVRFEPDGANGTSSDRSIEFRAWDQSSGVAGTKVDVSSNGGFSAFSTATETALITTTDVNDAPVLDNSGSLSLSVQAEDAGVPSGATGTAITDLVSLAGNVSDVDANASSGVAITALDGGAGSLWYTTDAGSNWSLAGALSQANALLLAADGDTRVYLQTPADFNGTIADAITFRAWDRSAGTNGAVADASSAGGTTPYSSATETADLTVTAVNDAPVNTVPGTQTVAEETTTAIAGISIADVDAGGSSLTTRLQVGSGNLSVTLSGSASISAGSNGTSDLTVQGSVADINATLASLTYTGNIDVTGVAADTLTVTTNDQGNAGSGGAQQDVDTVQIDITAVNDAPLNTVPGTQTVAEETTTAIAGLSIADVDAGSGNLTSRLQVSNGVLAVTLSGSASISAGTNGSADLTLQGTLADLNATLASLTYTGSTDVTGVAADTLSVTTNDLGNTGSGGAQQDVGTVQIDITAINDAPVNTVPGTQTVSEETATAIAGISMADVDAGSANLTSRLQVSNGVLSVTLSGSATISAGTNASADLTVQGSLTDLNATLASLTYTGNSDVTGIAADTLTVTTNDLGNTGSGGAQQDVDALQIDITAVNDAPVNTVPGTQTLVEETTTAIAGVSIADVDAGSGNLTSRLQVSSGVLAVTLSGSATISAGTNGSADLTVQGTLADLNATLASLTYTGNTDVTGTAADTLTVTTNDLGNTGSGGAQQDVDTVQIDITAVNDPPVNTVPGTQIVFEETATGIAGISIADVDAGSGNLTSRLQVGSGILSVTLSGSATIAAGSNGTSDLTVQGSVADINATLASLTYTGNTDVIGVAGDTLTITTNDQGNTGSGGARQDVDSVQIDISAVNDAPVNTVPGTQTVAEETTTAIAGISIADVDAGSGNLTSRLQVSSGVLSVTLSGSAIISAGSNGSSDLTVQGSVAEINATLASLTYTGNTDVTGVAADTLTLTTNDLGNTGSGGAQQDVDTVQIDITAVNDAPVNTVPGTQTVAEETTTAIAGISIADVDAGGGSLTTRLQVGSGILSVTLSGSASISAGANGSADLTVQGTLADLNATLASLTYTGNTDVTGVAADTLTVTTNDLGNTGSGGAQLDVDTVQIDIAAINDAPVNTVPGTQTVAEETTTAIAGISIADVDAGGGSLTSRLQVGNGSLSVTLSGLATISAGTNGSADLTIQGTLADLNATLASLTYTGNTDVTGTAVDTLTITTNDLGNTGIGGTQQDVDTVQIDIAAVNDPPVNTVPGTQTLSEDTAAALTGVSVSDVDVAGAAMTTRLQVSNGRLTVSLAGAALIVAGANDSADLTVQAQQAELNATLASLAYTPDANIAGVAADTLTVTTADQGNTGSGGILLDTDTVQIDITAINDAPVIVAPVSQAADEETATGIGGISISDVDDAGANLTVRLQAGNGTMAVVLTGGATVIAGGNATSDMTIQGSEAQLNAALASLAYTGDTDVTGAAADSITITVNDSGNTGAGGPQQSVATVTIDLLPVNDPPVLVVNTGASVSEGGTVILDDSSLRIDDPDTAAQDISLTLTATPTSGTLMRDGATLATGSVFSQADLDSGRITYQHSGAEVFSDSFAFIYADGNGPATGSPVSFAISVVPVNDNNPIIASNGGGAAASINIVENTTNVTTVAATDADLPAQSLSYSISGGADQAAFAIDANSGVLTLTAPPDFESPGDADADNRYQVVVAVSDAAFSDSQQLTITVSDVNEAPFNLRPARVLIAENVQAGAVLATLEANDPDAGDSIRYQINDGSLGRFELNAETGELALAPGSRLDFGVVPVYQLSVQATDSGGLTHEAIVTVQLQRVADWVPSNEPGNYAPAEPVTIAPMPTNQVADAAKDKESASPAAKREPDSAADESGGTVDVPSAERLNVIRVVADLEPIESARRSLEHRAVVADELELLELSITFDWLSPLNQSTPVFSVVPALATEPVSVSFERSSFESPEDDLPDSFAELVTDPVRVAGSLISVGAVWWLTRSGGLIATMLMGIPTWRHLDLLPVVSADMPFDTPDDDETPRSAEDELVEALFELQYQPRLLARH